MKKMVMFFLAAVTIVANMKTLAQEDKSKRPSPPAKVSATVANGNTITINYSQPGVKGRTIGKDIAPFDKVWRTGANEATVFEISKNAKIQGRFALPAGKYSLYTIPTAKTWTVIVNKIWDPVGDKIYPG